MKYLIISIVLLLSACSDPELEYIRVSECPEENFDRIEEFIMSCRLNSSVHNCRKEAEAVFCKDSFVKNPNFRED